MAPDLNGKFYFRSEYRTTFVGAYYAIDSLRGNGFHLTKREQIAAVVDVRSGLKGDSHVVARYRDSLWAGTAAGLPEETVRDEASEKWHEIRDKRRGDG